MQSKNIVFVKENTARIVAEEVPQLHAGQVLVKLQISTISSGTERANLTGCKTVSPLLPDAPVAEFPRRGGYSSAGIVMQVGEGVTSVRPGDRVAVSWSTHNQYVVAKESNLCSGNRRYS